MKENVKEKQKKGMIRDPLFLCITLIIVIILLSIFPDKREAVAIVSWKFLIEMIWIIPDVMVLMGLFAVFVSKEMVVKY